MVMGKVLLTSGESGKEKTTANMGCFMSADGKYDPTSPIQQHRSRGTDRPKL
jgi:hypothetical protein